MRHERAFQVLGERASAPRREQRQVDAQTRAPAAVRIGEDGTGASEKNVAGVRIRETIVFRQQRAGIGKERRARANAEQLADR